MAKKGGQRTVTTQQLDPASQRYLDAQRMAAQDAANVASGLNPFQGPQTQSVADQAAAFMNPYQDQVINAVGSQFDKLRTQAANSASAMATRASAFGGSRHGVAQGVRMANLDQQQMGIVSGLMNSGYQNALQQGTQYAEHQRQLAEQARMAPLWQQQNRMNFLTGGMGPYGQQTTEIAPRGSRVGAIAGGAQAGSAFGPWGAAAGGLLGGLFG